MFATNVDMIMSKLLTYSEYIKEDFDLGGMFDEFDLKSIFADFFDKYLLHDPEWDVITSATSQFTPPNRAILGLTWKESTHPISDFLFQVIIKHEKLDKDIMGELCDRFEDTFKYRVDKYEFSSSVQMHAYVLHFYLVKV